MDITKTIALLLLAAGVAAFLVYTIKILTKLWRIIKMVFRRKKKEPEPEAELRSEKKEVKEESTPKPEYEEQKPQEISVEVLKAEYKVILHDLNILEKQSEQVEAELLKQEFVLTTKKKELEETLLAIGVTAEEMAKLANEIKN